MYAEVTTLIAITIFAQRSDNGHSHNNLSCITNRSNNYRDSCSSNNRKNNRDERSSSSYESDRCCCCAPRYDSHSHSRSCLCSHNRSQQTSSSRYRHGSDERNVRRSRMTRSHSPYSCHDEPSSKRRRIMFSN